MNWLNFNVKQCIIPSSYRVTMTLHNFGVDWANDFPRCRSACLKLLYISKYLSGNGKVLFNDDHKTKQRSRLIPKDDIRVPLLATAPRISYIVRIKQAQKSHWVTEWLKLFVTFQQKKNLNMAIYSFFLTFCPLTLWYASSYETVFRIPTTSANHFLKSIKSLLVRTFY